MRTVVVIFITPGSGGRWQAQQFRICLLLKGETFRYVFQNSIWGSLKLSEYSNFQQYLRKMNTNLVATNRPLSWSYKSLMGCFNQSKQIFQACKQGRDFGNCLCLPHKHAQHILLGCSSRGFYFFIIFEKRKLIKFSITKRTIFIRHTN
jgi:hypothetical protein